MGPLFGKLFSKFLKTLFDIILNALKDFLLICNMTDYIYCQYCKVDISYVKDKDRYVTCPKCKQDIYLGTGKLYKKGKFKCTINS